MLSNPALGLTKGQINSLTDKLNNILASIGAGDYKQAENQLQAFINSITGQANTGKISLDTAYALIAAAKAIIQMLQP